MTDLAALARLPFQPQLAALAAWRASGRPVGALLEALAAYPDHEPLARTLRALAQGPAPAFDEAAPTLRRVLPNLSDSALQRVLRALGHQDLDPAQLARVSAVMWEVWEQLGLARVAAFCLLDRWLKNADPATYQGRQEALRQRLADHLIYNDREEPDDHALLRASGRWMEGLRALAASHGRQAAWEARLRGFSAQVLRTLQGLPRSLSQANAEEILSKRIYTDPGHFLVELLQNAEDSGAARFWVGVDAGEAWVWHDGAPFDAKDVVGVLSIGQSTKGRGQIGFFGVGFKSVYEVCERPQVYSELFSFEIADVSIPREMGARPHGPWPTGGTLLVLPWRGGSDDAPLQEAVLQHARAIPPEVLLTLAHVREMRVFGRGEAWSSARQEQPHPGEVALRITRGEAHALRRYQTARGLVVAEAGTRERARAAQSEVLVAARLDPQTGAPVRVGRHEPSLYNHLPTREPSPLGWLVHAAFDQPVDRERLDLSSAWNRALLREAGRVAPQLFAALLENGCDGAALLDLIPTRDEAEEPAWRGLREALLEGVRPLPLLRSAQGALPCGEARLVLDPALARVLDGATWSDGRRCCDAAALGASPGRRLAVARELGALDLTPQEALDALVADASLLARVLASSPDAWEPLHAWLERLPRAADLGLGAVAWFPIEGGGWASLRGPDGAWVAPPGPWGAWVRGFQARPPLALDAFAARFEGWLRRLGARTLDLETLVARVEAGELPLEGPDCAHFHQGLAEMAQDVTPRQREALTRARVWPRADGGLSALDDLRRVAPSEPLERVWRHTTPRALWDDRDHAAARSLDALRLPNALAESSWPALWDALRATPLRQRAEQPHEDAWARALRQSLAALGDALAPWKPQASAALTALPLWPTRAGGRATPSKVARGRSLRAEAWLAGLALDDGDGALGWLAEEAEDDAQALCDLLPFRSPVEAVVHGLTRSAQLGAPLAAQRPPLDTPEGVARLAAWLWPSLGPKVLELPLAVDLEGRLARAPRHRAASEDEAWVCEIVGLRGLLADPRWATLAQEADPRLTPPVPVARVCAELARALRGGEADALLADPARLYRWIEARRADIERDEAALHTLGQAPIVKTEADTWKPPRAILWSYTALDDDLGLEAWRCGPSVAPATRAWFEARFAWEESSLQGLMGALVELHKEAQSHQDGPRSARLWGAMAKALRAEQPGTSDEALGRAAERHKLHKLRVEGREGGWERPDHFLSSRSEWLDQALVAQVPVVHGAYEAQEPSVRRLLEAAGARLWWDAEPLIEAIVERRNLKPGLDAACALACYAARWLAHPPHAKHAPRLRGVAWVPTAAGALAPPSALYWPGPDLEALLGDRPALRPHPAFFHAAPAESRALLGFLDAREARVEDVLAPWVEAEGQRPLPAAVLSWLEGRLRQKAVTGQELRQKLQGRAVFQDDEGALRPPELLICTPAKAWIGDQRAVWSQGLRWSKLAAELGVPRQVGVAEALAFGAWAEGRLRERGPAGFLAEDGARLEQLQRCTALLVERNAPARPDWPLAVVEPSGEVSLRRLDDPALLLWSPARLVEEAERRGLTAPTPWLLDEERREETERWLLAGGVKDLRAALGEPVENTPAPKPQAPLEPPKQARKVPDHAKPVPPRSHTKAQPSPAQATPASSTIQAHADAPQAHEPSPQPPPEPGPAQTPTLPQGAPAEAEPASGLWGRVKRWFGGDEKPAAPEAAPNLTKPPENKGAPPRSPKDAAPQAPPTGLDARHAPPPARPKPAPPDPKRGAEAHPFKPSDHSRWFRPASSVEAQLEGAPAWVQDRARRPEFGFSFRPTSLPWPYKYAVKVLGGRFERATQRWLPSPAASPAWLTGGAPLEEAEVALKGRVPAGENIFPLPMYARWGELLHGHAQALSTREGGLLLLLDHPQDLSARLTLTAAPRFEGAMGALEAPKELLEETVPDGELPEEVLSWVGWLKGEGLAPLERAKAVQAFIQGRYRYDPSYLEDPQEARRRLRLAQGSAHLHLAAMHADRDARHLGRGVCHEFGALACELLRRVGVPAAVATGWTWDRGQLGEADHMWAMALLPSDLGPRWAPIDAATTREGRPLHHGARPPGGWTPPPSKGAAPLPQAPAWTQSPKGRWDAPREQRRNSGSEQRRGDERRGGADPAELLALVVEHMAKQTGEPVPDDLRATCEAALADPETARALWALLGLGR